MCIWKVSEKDRHCELCLYCGKCERQFGPNAEGGSEAETCIKVMNGIIGLDIRTMNRSTLVRWGRYFLMYKLRRDGYTLNRIGKLLDRDHTTVMHGLKCAYHAIDNPRAYPDVIPIWNSFSEKLSLHKTITV